MTVHVLSRVCAVLTLVPALSVLGYSETLRVPRLSLDSLSVAAGFPDSLAGRRLHEALVTDGLVAIDGIPDFGRLRESALVWAHSCGEAVPGAFTSDLLDGTRRRTLAATAEGTHSLPAIDLGLAAGQHLPLGASLATGPVG